LRKHKNEDNAFRDLVVKWEEKRQSGRPSIRWEDNVKQALEETGGKELDVSGFGKGQVES